MKIFSIFSLFFTSFISLFSNPVQTDHAIFLFDNGEKNLIASMLHFAEKEDKEALDSLDFRIVFMGASLDAMQEEPFCRYREKLLSYEELGIQEKIDRHWKREQNLSKESIKYLTDHLEVRKKVWTGVSALFFSEILKVYQDKGAKGLALRDNPFPSGDTEYFSVADRVQASASTTAVTSKILFDKHERAIIIGHPPTEEWLDLAKQIDKDSVLKRLELDPNLPIVVYTGSYGPAYESAFLYFLEMLSQKEQKDLQVIIVPHPRYKGAFEKRLFLHVHPKVAQFLIVSEWEEEPSKKCKALEAIVLADCVLLSDPTSTVVFQAAALSKKVGLVQPIFTKTSHKMILLGLMTAITNLEDLKNLRKTQISTDLFSLLQIPQEGARLLWEECLN